jgi:hypothetical protein
LSKKLAIQTVNTIKKELTSKLKTYSEDQAIAYVEKTYGKPYADLLKNSKAAYEVGHGSHEIATNVKDWKKAGQNLANSGNWSGEQYKNVVSNTQKVVKAGDELINGEPKKPIVKPVA